MGQHSSDQILEKQTVVIDASVAAKWYLEEEHSDHARRLRDSFVLGTVTISVPALLLYETLNALKYSGVYDEKELEAAASSLSKYGFEVFQPTGELYRETAHDSVRHDISVYDASYIALSTHLKVPLFTVDREILDKFPRKARHISAFKE